MLDLVVAPHWTVTWPEGDVDAEDEIDVVWGLVGVTTNVGREKSSAADGIAGALFAPCVRGVSGLDCSEYTVDTAGASSLGRGGVAKGSLFGSCEAGISGLNCGEYTVDTAGASCLGCK